MSAVSKSVIPCSIAASTTDFAWSKSIRGPKLFVPRPTTDTSGPPRPSSLVRMLSDATGGRVRTAAMGGNPRRPEADTSVRVKTAFMQADSASQNFFEVGTFTFGGYPPFCLSLRMERCRKLSRMDDGQRLRRAGQGDVELSQAGVSAFLDDGGRLDDHDVVELEALRLARGQDGDRRLVECLHVEVLGCE